MTKSNRIPKLKYLTEDQLGFFRAHDDDDLASLAAAEIDHLRETGFVSEAVEDGEAVITVLPSAMNGFYLLIYEDAHGDLSVQWKIFADLPDSIQDRLVVAQEEWDD